MAAELVIDRAASLDEQLRQLVEIDPLRFRCISPAQWNREKRRLAALMRRRDREVEDCRVRCRCEKCRGKRRWPSYYVGSRGMSLECAIEGRAAADEPQEDGLADALQSLQGRRDRVGSVFISQS